MRENFSTAVLDLEKVHKGQKSVLLKSKNGIRWINYDILAGALSLTAGVILSPYESFESITQNYLSVIIIYGIILATISRLTEVPRPGFDFHIARYDVLSSGILAVFFSIITFSFLILLFDIPHDGRYIILNTAIISYILICIPRVILTQISNKSHMNLALWGSNELTELFIKRIKDSEDFKVKGFLSFSDSDYTRHKYGLRVINEKDLDKINCVILCSDISPETNINNKLMQLPMQGVEVLNKGAFIEKYFRVISLDYLNVHWLASFPSLSNDSTSFFAKRITDIIVSSILLAFTLPFLPLFALLIKLDSKGSVFYTQTRVGRFNKPFTIYKLRSMIADAEKSGAQWALTHDDRITKLGAFLRRSRIDELPQLWNVLKGDMSMVGPRPERPEFEKMLIKDLPLYERRHLISPGITGWAQIRYKYSASIEDSRTKLEHDLYYIKHMSFVFDLKVIMKTFIMVMKGSR